MRMQTSHSACPLVPSDSWICTRKSDWTYNLWRQQQNLADFPPNQHQKYGKCLQFSCGPGYILLFFMVGVSCLWLFSKENPFLLRAVMLSTRLVCKCWTHLICVFLSFYFFLPHTQCSLYLSLPMQTLLLHHTMFPIPTQRLSSQRISCAPQGFPSPHVWDLLEYRRDRSVNWVQERLAPPTCCSTPPEGLSCLDRSVGNNTPPLCSHQGEKRDKNGGINETGLGWGGRCLAEQVFGSHTLSTWTALSLWNVWSVFMWLQSLCFLSLQRFPCLLLYTAFQSCSYAVVLSCSKFLCLI